MSNPPSAATHTGPLVIKPYAFPDPSCQARVASVIAIDPQLNPTPAPPSYTPQTRFSSDDLEHLVRIVAEEEPWAKPHSQVTKSWGAVLQRLQSKGRFQSSCITTIQNKVNVLIAWQEVP